MFIESGEIRPGRRYFVGSLLQQYRRFFSTQSAEIDAADVDARIDLIGVGEPERVESDGRNCGYQRKRKDDPAGDVADSPRRRHGRRMGWLTPSTVEDRRFQRRKRLLRHCQCSQVTSASSLRKRSRDDGKS
jgi:hypothetical protein